MKGVIVYKAKYGATRKYVEWLFDETGFDTVETSNAKINEIQKYDVIVLVVVFMQLELQEYLFFKRI